MKDLLKELIGRLSVCLSYAGEDIEDFLWVLDQDEKDGRAPAEIDKLRDLYHQIKDQYAQDARDLSEAWPSRDSLELAIHMIEVYQAMFDYLMSGDDADYAGEPVEEAGRPRLGPRDADFSAMFELFKKNKDLPS